MFGPRTAEQLRSLAWVYMVDHFRAAVAAEVIIDSDRTMGPLLDMFAHLGFDALYPVKSAV